MPGWSPVAVPCSTPTWRRPNDPQPFSGPAAPRPLGRARHPHLRGGRVGGGEHPARRPQPDQPDHRRLATPGPAAHGRAGLPRAGPPPSPGCAAGAGDGGDLGHRGLGVVLAHGRRRHPLRRNRRHPLPAARLRRRADRRRLHLPGRAGRPHPTIEETETRPPPAQLVHSGHTQVSAVDVRDGPDDRPSIVPTSRRGRGGEPARTRSSTTSCSTAPTTPPAQHRQRRRGADITRDELRAALRTSERHRRANCCSYVRAATQPHAGPRRTADPDPGEESSPDDPRPHHPTHRRSRPRPCPGRGRGRPGWPSRSRSCWRSATSPPTTASVCTRPQVLRMTNLATGRDRGHRPALPRHPRSQVPGLRQTQGQTAAPGPAMPRGLAPRRRTRPQPAPGQRRTGRCSLAAGATSKSARAECRDPADWDRVAESTSRHRRGGKLIAAAGLRGRTTTPQPGPTTRGRGRQEAPRRKRSTRRRQDAPDLPRRKMTARTIGRTFAGNGRHDVYRPSTFLTLTLDSYGRVRDDGSPVDPATLRLPPRGLGRRALPRPARPVLAEPAPGRRLEHPVLRRRRTPTPPRPARPLRRPRHHSRARRSCGGRRRDLSPGVVATRRRRHLRRRRRAAGLGPDAGPRRPTSTPAPDWPLPTWAEAMDVLDDALDADPDREPEHVVRFGVQIDARRRPRRHRRGGQAHRVHHQVPDQIRGRMPQPATPAAVEAPAPAVAKSCGSRRARPGARTGCATASNPKAPAPRCAPAVARPRCTNSTPSASAAAASSSPGTGPARPSPTTAGTRPPGSAKSSPSNSATPNPATKPATNRSHAARNGGAPAPIRWERARPNDPDIPELPSRLLRAIATRMKQKAALRAAMALAPPPAQMFRQKRSQAIHPRPSRPKRRS